MASPSTTEGTGNAGCPLHPQPRVRNWVEHTSVVTTGSPEQPGIPCAMVLTAYSVLSPVTGLSCHRRCADNPAKLDASVGASGPHGFAVRVSTIRQARCRVHRIPHPTSVTIALRPLCPESLAECANGWLPTNRPLLELSPLRPRGDRACLRAGESSGVVLNPNSCKGFAPVPNKEGSG